MTNLLRFKQLKERRIADSWAQLKNLISKYGFPPGFMPSPNARAWFEDEVEAWLEAKAAKASAEATLQLKGAAKQPHEASPEDRSAIRKAFVAKSREARGSA